MMLSNGTVLVDRYEIIERLGMGGMAIAYRGKDLKLGRNVTLKVLREEFVQDEDFIERFKIEARSAARLSHPNIVNVYDVGEDNGIHFIVMEYVHGDTLKKAIQEKAPFDTKSILNVSVQLASALAHAHKNHIVHRDIKPQNILVGADGVIKVTDFGIARATGNSTTQATSQAVGSVHYFSPEQARGGYVDDKSDIYSMGITMYEMVTGRIPYDGENSVAIALMHINEDLPDMSLYNPNVTRSVEGIIRKATKKRADERYASIDLLLEDLYKARTDNSGNFIVVPPVKTEYDLQPRLDYYSAGKNTAGASMEDLSMDRNRNDYSRGDSGHKLQISRGNDYEEGYEDMPKKQSRPKSKQPAGRGYGAKPNSARKVPSSRYEDEDYDEDNHRKKQEKKIIIAAVITAVLIICAISFAGYKMMGGNGGLFANSKTADISVPSFIGLTLEEAKKQASALGLKLSKEAEDYSDQEKGLVYMQDLEEGMMARKNEEVLVRISLGMKDFKMPEVTDLKEQEASTKIYAVVKDADIIVEYKFNEDVDTGKVITQSPAAGRSFNEKTKVTLVVSKGAENKKILMPSLIGLSEAEAQKAVESLGLIIGSKKTEESESIAKGYIISQSLDAGDEVSKNTTVDLVVSKGAPKKVEEEKPKPEINSGEGDPAEDTTNSDNNNSNSIGENTTNTGNNTNSTQTPPAQITPPVQTTPPAETAPPAETTPPAQTPPPATTGSSTRNFPVYLKEGGGYGDTVHVKILKVEDGNISTIIDEQRSVTAFPDSVTVSGNSLSEVQCYVNNELLWSERVDFSTGGN